MKFSTAIVLALSLAALSTNAAPIQARDSANVQATSSKSHHKHHHHHSSSSESTGSTSHPVGYAVIYNGHAYSYANPAAQSTAAAQDVLGLGSTGRQANVQQGSSGQVSSNQGASSDDSLLQGSGLNGLMSQGASSQSSSTRGASNRGASSQGSVSDDELQSLLSAYAQSATPSRGGT